MWGDPRNEESERDDVQDAEVRSGRAATVLGEHLPEPTHRQLISIVRAAVGLLNATMFLEPAAGYGMCRIRSSFHETPRGRW